MYSLHRLVTWLMVLISPVRMLAALPLLIPHTVHAQAAVTISAPYQVTLNTHSPQALEVHMPPRPNFDADVLAPLRAQQAAEAQAAAQAKAQAEVQAAAQARARAAALAAQQTTAAATAPATADAFTQLRYCESGGNYTRNSGNGYYGAYQYSLGTWNNYDGYARPDLAPPSVQDAKAEADQAHRGWSPWPACSRKLGLM